jgi:hypothetical protein
MPSWARIGHPCRLSLITLLLRVALVVPMAAAARVVLFLGLGSAR